MLVVAIGYASSAIHYGINQPLDTDEAFAFPTFAAYPRASERTSQQMLRYWRVLQPRSVILRLRDYAADHLNIAC